MSGNVKKTHSRLALFFDFLQRHEKDSTTFTIPDILRETGWKKSSVNAYLSKGQITWCMAKVDKHSYQAIHTMGLTFSQFRQKLSQSKNLRELGHKCKSGLAKALLAKSKDNMLLANVMVYWLTKQIKSRANKKGI